MPNCTVQVTRNEGRVGCQRCSMQPLNLASLQSNLQDALRMQQNLPATLRRQPTLSQLTRLTLVTEDPSAASQAFTGTHPAAASYDLLAVQPLSERVLQQASTVIFPYSNCFGYHRQCPPSKVILLRGTTTINASRHAPSCIVITTRTALY